MPRPHRIRADVLISATLVLVSIPVLVSCDGGTGPDETGLRRQIVEHRERWEARSFRDYSYRLQRNCFCGPEARGPVRVSVRQGQVVRVLEAETEEPVRDDLVHLFPGVAGLFSLLLDAVDRDAYEVEVEWDAELGYPTRFFIDYDSRTADEELGFDASDVTPLE